MNWIQHLLNGGVFTTISPRRSSSICAKRWTSWSPEECPGGSRRCGSKGVWQHDAYRRKRPGSLALAHRGEFSDGRALCAAHAAPESRVYLCGDSYAGARHRREHRHFQRDSTPCFSARSGTRSATTRRAYRSEEEGVWVGSSTASGSCLRARNLKGCATRTRFSPECLPHVVHSERQMSRWEATHRRWESPAKNQHGQRNYWSVLGLSLSRHDVRSRG